MKATSSGALEAAENPRHRNSVVRLGQLVGRWQVEGEVAATEHGPASAWASQEHAEWLPGENFIVHRWDARVGGRPFCGMAVFGCDEQEGYFATFYTDAGDHPTYLVTVDDETWTLTGEAQRATYAFAEGGRSIAIRWETKGDEGWQLLCQLSARRTDSH